MLRNNLSNLIRRQPWPLIQATPRTVVSWSAKSACTQVLIWHLERCGLLAEARRKFGWLHRYREEVYYSTDQYMRAVSLIQSEVPDLWSYVKVIRDPINRCVSSFRHALSYGYEDNLMTRVLKRRINHGVGFSYADFVEYLEKIDIQACNIHHQAQSHPLDNVAFGNRWLVNIDEQDLESALWEIDKVQGLAGQPSEARRDAVRGDSARYAPLEGSTISGEDIFRTVMTKETASAWPKQALQNCPEARRRVRAIYAMDYALLEGFESQGSQDKSTHGQVRA